MFAYAASKVKSNTMKFVFSLLAILVPSIMAGIRAPTVGVDVRGYALHNYNSARHAATYSEFVSSSHFWREWEVGWLLLTYISTKIFDSLNWNLFFYSLITCTCVYIGAWKHRKLAPLPLIMLIFFLLHYNSTYNIMRQAAACSIVFMGFDNLEKRQYWKFLIYIVAASYFHTSALLCIVYMIGFHFAVTVGEGRFKSITNIFLYSLILSCFMLEPIFKVVSTYIPPLATYSVRGISFNNKTVGIMLLGELMLFLFYPNGGRKVFRNSPGGEKMFDYYRYSVAFGIAFYWGARVFARGYFYFEYVNMLAFAVLHRFIINKYLRFIVLMITMLVYFGYFIQYFVVRNMENCGSFPYVTIFS
ncbi:MAG: EpsG family protein [Synergistaceae bacterium]|nr:EpsG family protein [Synergistaceae bacterium]MBR0034664.1 EpsG family protein [Synergistaceae bacterium]